MKKSLILLVFIFWSTEPAAIENHASQLSFNNFGKTIWLEQIKPRTYQLKNSPFLFQTSNQLIVKTAPHLTKQQLINLNPNIALTTPVFSSNSFTYYRLTLKKTAELNAILNILKTHESVLLAQPDLLQITSKKFQFQAPQKIDRRRFNQVYRRYLKKIGVHELWKKTKGQGIKLAIIDDGFNLAHEKLRQVNPYFMYDLDSQQITPEAMRQGAEHGTRVAGVILASHTFGHSEKEMESIQLPGIAPHVDFIALRHTDTWTSKTLLSFHIAALAGADIINCSWQSPYLLEPVADVVRELALNGRDGKGIAVVFAAGNEGKKITIQDTEASIDEAIVVAAGNMGYKRLKQSNFGPSVDVQIYGATLKSTSSNGDYQAFSGTSAASAITSGILSLLLAIDPEQTLSSLISKLQKMISAAQTTPTKNNPRIK